VETPALAIGIGMQLEVVDAPAEGIEFADVEIDALYRQRRRLPVACRGRSLCVRWRLQQLAPLVDVQPFKLAAQADAGLVGNARADVEADLAAFRLQAAVLFGAQQAGR